MFDERSRYASLETVLHLDGDRAVAYKRRRVLPIVDPALLGAEIAVGQGERVDLLGARVFGDPTEFWRLADANGVMHPRELVTLRDRALRRLSLPLPAGVPPLRR